MNLFEVRADWPIPHTQTPTGKVEKAKVPPRVAAIPHAMVLPKPQNNKPVEENVHGTELPHLQKGRGRRHRKLKQ